MKQLLKISFDQMLLSLTPILSWFCLSLLIDPEIINVFTLVYPLQYIYYIINSPLAIGANISKIKDRNKNAVMSGMLVGIVLALGIFGLVLLNIDPYIEFMNMDAKFYRTFTIYAVVILAMQTIFSFILSKLYYEEKNSTANKYSIMFNLLSFVSVNGMALLTKDQNLIITVALGMMGIFTLYVVARNWEKFRFRINLRKCLKYDSVSFFGYLMSFFIFLFGLSNALEYGEQYALAITFVALITDTQWDVLDSVTTLAKIDIAKRKFNFWKSLRNAYVLLGVLLASMAVMFVALFNNYDLDLGLTLIYFGFEIVSFVIEPVAYLQVPYLQLEWSASKTTVNRMIGRVIRMALSLLPTPFCTGIGEIGSVGYQVLTFNMIFNKHYKVDKNGRVLKRRTRRKALARQYRYSERIVDKE